MPLNAQNGRVRLGKAVMEYAAFGQGEHTLVLLPGLGDGLKNVAGMAVPLAGMYHLLAQHFRVLVLSRKAPLSPGSTTRDMAEDVVQALAQLGVQRASVVGVSMGGMIAQHLAIHHPDLVEKLVLTVTCPRPNPVMKASVGAWMDMARQGDMERLMVDNGRRLYSDGFLKRYGRLLPLVGKVYKPRSWQQFLIMSQACLAHDAWDGLPEIHAATLVIGGEQDKTLGGEASREIASRIPGSRLKMYPNYGHGVYEEAPDYQQTVLDFLMEADLYEKTT